MLSPWNLPPHRVYRSKYPVYQNLMLILLCNVAFLLCFLSNILIIPQL